MSEYSIGPAGPSHARPGSRRKASASTPAAAPSHMRAFPQRPKPVSSAFTPGARRTSAWMASVASATASLTVLQQRNKTADTKILEG